MSSGDSKFVVCRRKCPEHENRDDRSLRGRKSQLKHTGCGRPAEEVEVKARNPLIKEPALRLVAIDPWRINDLRFASMDAAAFRDRIKDWRMQADMSQEALDVACGFHPGTVGRMERGDLKLTDERLVAIILCTERDLLWTLAEGFGALFKRLRPLETSLRQRLGKGPPPRSLDEDEELEKALTSMLAGAKVVLRKQARAADRRALMIDFLLEAAARDAQSVQSGRQRVRGPRR
ncbi:MAG TPA: helix-turn-helix transcriptional regulator [Thermoanaerobaculia bacterium]